ncbi:MAG: Sec-independent protein translocase protein TatB [Steroidobacteraceae bacterium]
MLDFGFSEILLTSAIALVVLGPERLPKVARQVGNWVGRARVMARQLTEQLEREVTAEALLKQQSTAGGAAQPPALSRPVGQTPLPPDAPPAAGAPLAADRSPAAEAPPAADGPQHSTADPQQPAP